MRRAAECSGFLGVGISPQAVPWFGDTYWALAGAGLFVVACFSLFLWSRRPWEDCQ